MRPRASSQDGWPWSQVPSGSTKQPSVASQPPSSSTWRWSPPGARGVACGSPPSLVGGVGGGGRVRPWRGSGFAPAHPAPGVGHAGECAGGRRSPRLAFVGGLGLVGVGDLQGAGRAQPDDDVGLGCWVVGPTWASTSAAVAVGLPHNGHGRGEPTWLRSSAPPASGPVAGGDGLDLGHVGPGVVVGVQGPIQPPGAPAAHR